MPEAEQALFGKLLSRSRTATAEFADAYYLPLIDWLQSRNPRADEQWIRDAATLTFESITERSQQYKPELGNSLGSYLRMSANGDLKNLLEKERRKESRTNSEFDVELADGGGNYVGRELELHEDAIDRIDNPRRGEARFDA